MSKTYLDGKGNSIVKGQRAKMRIACGETICGVVHLVSEDLTTIRDDQEQLFGMPHSAVEMLHLSTPSTSVPQK